MTTDRNKLAIAALEDSNELLRTITDDGVEQSLAQIHDNLNVIELLQAQGEPHPWAAFLAARANVIDWMWDDKEHPRTCAEIAEALSMDQVQVATIRMRDRALDRQPKHVGAPTQVLEQIAERRIALNPEYDSGWHAKEYGESETPQAEGFGATPAEAIRSLKRPSQAQEPQQFDPLAVRELAKSFRENPREASLTEQAMLRQAAAASVSGAVDELPPLPDTDIDGVHVDGYSLTAVTAIQREAYELGLSRAQATQPAQQAPAVSDEHPQRIATLTKQRDGWKEEAEKLRQDCADLMSQIDLRTRHQRNDVWYWQGDGEDYPESMSNSMAVVIRADQLRALLSRPAAAPVSEQAVQQFTAADALRQRPHMQHLNAAPSNQSQGGDKP
jgi:hypothetical protein